jgi:hypothetical protein
MNIKPSVNQSPRFSFDKQSNELRKHTSYAPVFKINDYNQAFRVWIVMISPTRV